MIIDQVKWFLACARAGVKPTEVVKRAGVTSTTLANIKHKKNVTTVVAGKLAAALGVDVTELLALD